MNSPGIVNAMPTSDEIYISGACYLPARNIARQHGYVRDYVTRLCREGKVQGRRLGTLWYVNTDSFAAFLRRTDNNCSTATQEASHNMV